jgi:hypothetical protein
MGDERDAMRSGLFGLKPPGLAARVGPKDDSGPPPEEESCLAFGYVRGQTDRALAVEFRLRTGDSEWFPYSHLAAWRYNPSVGLLLRYTADVVTLVLVRGSNLDVPVNAGGRNQAGANLTDRGFQRHRVVWVKEMDGGEQRRAGEREPSVDRIEIAEFESHDDLRAWLRKTAPAFVR